MVGAAAVARAAAENATTATTTTTTTTATTTTTTREITGEQHHEQPRVKCRQRARRQRREARRATSAEQAPLPLHCNTQSARAPAYPVRHWCLAAAVAAVVAAARRGPAGPPPNPRGLTPRAAQGRAEGLQPPRHHAPRRAPRRPHRPRWPPTRPRRRSRTCSRWLCRRRTGCRRPRHGGVQSRRRLPCHLQGRGPLTHLRTHACARTGPG
jgi:hypothetical protein